MRFVRSKSVHGPAGSGVRASPHARPGAVAVAVERRPFPIDQVFLISLRNHGAGLNFAAGVPGISGTAFSPSRVGRGVGVLEGLERRRMLAAAVSVVAGKLTIAGTAN